MGSAGGSQGSGSRVHPGKKMAGNMGNQSHTVQNLKVMLVDVPNGLVVVAGEFRKHPIHFLVLTLFDRRRGWT